MPYARPDALVSTDWLAARLGDPHIRVVDASFKLPGITPTAREDYDRGHIPGAVFFDIDDIARPGTSLPHMIPPPDLFARKMEALGIGDDDRVVVYDSVGLSSAGRAWWMLHVFGHHDVAILDGGPNGRPGAIARQRGADSAQPPRWPARVRDKSGRPEPVDAVSRSSTAAVVRRRPKPGPFAAATWQRPTTGSPIHADCRLRNAEEPPSCSVPRRGRPTADRTSCVPALLPVRSPCMHRSDIRCAVW
jgi:thiosulfate/3-mercaptopyruvate sulfurtransferase